MPYASCSSISEEQILTSEEHKTPKKKWEVTLKFSPKHKVMIGRCASENGVTKALRCFKEKELKKYFLRLEKVYELNLWEKRKSMEPGKPIIVSSLGTKLDLLLQQ